MPVDRRTVRASVCAASSLDVDELVLADAVVGHGQAPGGDEPLGRCGREPVLVGPALRRQTRG